MIVNLDRQQLPRQLLDRVNFKMAKKLYSSAHCLIWAGPAIGQPTQRVSEPSECDVALFKGRGGIDRP